MSTLMELAKGQEGGLAVGREIVNPGERSLHWSMKKSLMINK
jgi:hypothetical protein